MRDVLQDEVDHIEAVRERAAETVMSPGTIEAYRRSLLANFIKTVIAGVPGDYYVVPQGLDDMIEAMVVAYWSEMSGLSGDQYDPQSNQFLAGFKIGVGHHQERRRAAKA